MRKFLNLPLALRWYIAGISLLSLGLAIWQAPGVVKADEALRLTLLVGWMAVCSYFRINLPIRGGRMTLGNAGVSLAQMVLGTREAMLVAGVGAGITCFAERPVVPETGKRRPLPLYQLVFNIANCLVAAGLAGTIFKWTFAWTLGHFGLDPRLVEPPSDPQSRTSWDVATVLATLAWIPAYFTLNTAGVATAIALRTKQSFAKLWQENFFWAAAGAVLSAVFSLGVHLSIENRMLWAYLFLPPVFLVYNSYRMHVNRLQAARQYQQLIERARDGVVILRQNEVVYANEAFARLLRLPRAELAGCDYRKFLAEGESPPVALPDGAEAEILEQSLRRLDGAAVQVEISASAVYYHGQECVQALVRDVSERQVLRRQAAQGEKLRALGQMAFGVAHDFNNSLMAVLGNVTLARMALRTDCGAPHLKAEERLQLAEKAATDASNTVRRLQAFGRPAVGPQECVDLQEIAREVLLMTRPVWRDGPRAEGREILADVTGEPRVYVRCNPAELREALTNLVYNAVHAMPNGGRINVRTARMEGTALLSVADTGQGMPEEVLSRLFEPFFTTKGAAGSGLGLFVTYGLISQQGGRIDVDSVPGAGSTFHLRFPEAPPAETRPDAVQARPRPGTRVLVVDDEADVRDVIGSMLRGAGVVVREAINGSAALTALRSESFDLVITDLSMPEMSGLDLARAARSRDPGLPILLLTGWEEGAEMARSNREWVNDILTKPVTLPALLHHVALLPRATTSRMVQTVRG